MDSNKDSDTDGDKDRDRDMYMDICFGSDSKIVSSTLQILPFLLRNVSIIVISLKSMVLLTGLSRTLAVSLTLLSPN